MSHDDIKAALEAATRQPWALLYPGQCCEGFCIESEDGRDAVAHGLEGSVSDLNLITSAPTWLAELLAEVNEAQAEAMNVGHDYDRRGERLWRLAALAGWTPDTDADNDATAESYIKDRLAEVESLARWKAEALPVIYGLQELGAALGIRLGKRITGPDALEASKALTARADAAEAERDQLREEARRFAEALGFGDGHTERAATLAELVDPLTQAMSDAGEHQECPVVCELCGERLAAATCEACRGSGCLPNAEMAYLECGTCAGVGKVHNGCAESAGHRRIQADVAALDPLSWPCWGKVSSPPCQAWSMAGKRKGELDRANCHALADRMAAGDDSTDWCTWEDPRSALVCQPVRWVRDLRPEWVALEEVPAVAGLWEHFARIFRGWGYSHVVASAIGVDPTEAIDRYYTEALGGAA